MRNGSQYIIHEDGTWIARSKHGSADLRPASEMPRKVMRAFTLLKVVYDGHRGQLAGVGLLRKNVTLVHKDGTSTKTYILELP